jgi:hypothetical protein
MKIKREKVSPLCALSTLQGGDTVDIADEIFVIVDFCQLPTLRHATENDDCVYVLGLVSGFIEAFPGDTLVQAVDATLIVTTEKE